MLLWEISDIACSSGGIGVLETLLFDPSILQQIHAVDSEEHRLT